MRWLVGHLGPAVSALVDGQLDEESTDRAWQHITRCPSCRAAVEREVWVKDRLARMTGNQPSTHVPSDLLGALHELPVDDTLSPWADPVEAPHSRRRAGIAAAGAGSVSVAVLGFAALSGALSAGSPAASITGPPSSSPSAPATARVGLTVTVHGRLPGWRTRSEDPSVAFATPAVAHR